MARAKKIGVLIGAEDLVIEALVILKKKNGFAP